MVASSIIEKVNAVLADEFEVEAEDITLHANLRETLDLDSLDFVDLVVIIEDNFGFKVNREDLKAIETFEHLYDYIHKNVSA
ncbi:MAG: acyl carrier protein [Saprospiraceae bacterium]|jgi:acyl carrier protein|nr:acyl carrier protein [Saprospiraceae bacterium]NUQ24783.1 acyl carrier protein [Saprospiraceae bacterium]